MVSKGFLDKCWSLIEIEAEQQAQKDLEEQRKNPRKLVPNESDSDDESIRKGKRGKKLMAKRERI